MINRLKAVASLFEQADVSKTLIKFYANSWVSKRMSNDKISCFQHDMGYGMSNDKISSVNEFERLFVKYKNASIKLKFDEIILKQKLSTSLGLIANYYIVYILSPNTNSFNIGFENCLFGKTKMTKSVDPDKYKYQDHGIGYGSTGNFTHPDGSACKNVIIFGVDMTNSIHANNKTKDVLVLG